MNTETIQTWTPDSVEWAEYFRLNKVTTQFCLQFQENINWYWALAWQSHLPEDFWLDQVDFLLRDISQSFFSTYGRLSRNESFN